jgi:two-component system, LytTR family, sensor kinase
MDTKVKWRSILVHIIFWLTFLSLPRIISLEKIKRPEEIPQLIDNDFPILILFQGILIAFFYLNADLYIPRFLKKGKLWLYFSAVFASIIVMFSIFYLIFRFWFQIEDVQPFPAIFPISLVLGLSFGYRYFVDRNKEEQLRKERDFENIKSELYFLRSQISPHFIFNVLNSMVSLSRKRSDLMEPILIKLSELMRYILYETSHTVQLSTEIEYIQSYIDLQTLRFGDKVPVTFKTSGTTERFEIEPMLLIPLVENAFKHGVGLMTNPSIHISVEVNIGGELRFNVRNRYEHAQTLTKENGSGIGLKNLQRRLNLLYDKRHELVLKKDDDWYQATLLLKL